MRTIGFIALLVTLFISLFRFGGADLTNNVLAIALMVLLVILFSDLKEFNFWGLSGKKKEQELRETVGKEPISEDLPKVKRTEVQKAQQQNVIHLMDNTQENFLALAFEIERLLRVAATILSATDIPSNTALSKIIKTLKEKGLLTDVGEKQVDLIRWIRNMLIHGRSHEINQATLENGVQVANTFYLELKNWLDGSSNTQKNT